MSMISCPECGKEISDKAMSCPNCGYVIKQSEQNMPETEPNKNKKEKKKDSKLSIFAAIFAFFTWTWWIGLILAIIDFVKNKNDGKRHIGSWFAIIFGIFYIFIAFVSPSENNNKTENIKDVQIENFEQEQKEEMENSIVLYYMELYENYEDYLGQYVTISAPLSYVKNETVNIKGDIEGTTGMINVTLSENDKNLSEGDYVTVTGRIDKKALGYLYMKDAHILEVGDNPCEIYNQQKEEYDKLLAQNKEEDKNTSDEKEDNESADNTFHVGDVLETKSVRLSFLSCGEYQDSNMFVEAGEDNKFIYLEFEFENIGSTDTTVGSWDFDCYADGYEASNAYATADNAMTSITTLSSGRKTEGIVVFEVPKNAEKIEVEYETNYWTQDKAIFIYE